ncbi:P-loop NTPase fold protein [Acidovorax sp. Leaf78]|uniref:KAP family P-loop NTPase fold protein n=1 Tax=Acidovorax sp. Leaf78 TaxID=1736237 RepID=UPI0009E7B606|nr:P-loop NTPase fold protein [Acidovorax sp. Leaf78]
MNKDHWGDDLMKREASGNFLYKLVQAKYKAIAASPKSASLTFALDGGWGTGKSFFVERWSKDIENQQHAVIRFDAWKNDLSDDPLIGFMAELNSTLKPFIDEIPALSEESKKKLLAQAKKVVSNSRKAIFPALKQLGKGLATRYMTLEGAEQVQSILMEDADASIEIKEQKKITDKAIENFFNGVLKSHTSQKMAIADFISELERLASYLESTNEINLPIYIFIDELDRCRPSYAIRLLEGIKHVLNARGVCFIISTNLTQLSHSIKSVYGAGFDGQNYLKRFFDFEYKLPAPDNLAHARNLHDNSSFLLRPNLITGLETLDVHGRKQIVEPRDIFSYIANTFELDLRSQKQVFTQAEGAIASIPDNENVYLTYIFALAALAHKSPQDIDGILDGRLGKFPTDKLITINFKTKYHDSNGSLRDKQYSLSEILNFYHNNAFNPIEKVREQFRNSNLYDYPQSMLEGMLNDSSGKSYLNIKKYVKLIRLAGDISAAN